MAKKTAVTKGEWEGEIRLSGNKIYKRVYNGSSSRPQTFGEAVYYTCDNKSAEVVEQAATARLSLYCGVVNNPDAPDDDGYAIAPHSWGWVCIQGEVPHMVNTEDFAVVAGEPLVGVNSKSEQISDGTRASGTVTIGTFGEVAGKILTVGGVALTEGVDFDAEAIAATATVIVVDYEELGLETFTIVVPSTTTVLTEDSEWTAGTSNAETATSLASAINAVTGVGASATGNVITITATTAGVAGNAITIASSADPADLELSGASLSGGIAGDVQTAANLAEAINDLDAVMATSAAEVVTIRARVAGTGGNAITLTTNEATHMAVSGATLSGGAAIGKGSRQSNSVALESADAGEGVVAIKGMVRAFI